MGTGWDKQAQACTCVAGGRAKTIQLGAHRRLQYDQTASYRYLRRPCHLADRADGKTICSNRAEQQGTGAGSGLCEHAYGGQNHGTRPPGKALVRHGSAVTPGVFLGVSMVSFEWGVS